MRTIQAKLRHSLRFVLQTSCFSYALCTINAIVMNLFVSLKKNDHELTNLFIKYGILF